MRKKRILTVTEFTGLNTGYATYYKHLLTELYKSGKYELTELAAYCDHNNRHHQNLLRNIPWRVISNMPGNESERQQYNSHPINEFGKFKFEYACLESQPDIVCFPPKTPVMTAEGYKYISDIKVGDNVLTHQNRFRQVTKTMRRDYSGKLIAIYTNGCSEPIKLTPEHPVLVYRNRNQTNKKKNTQDIYKDEIPEFVPAKDVKSKDSVVLPTFNCNNYLHLDIRNYLKNFITVDDIYLKENSHPNNVNLIKYKIDIDEKLGRLAGYIIGDGYIAERGITISFGSDEERFVDDAVAIFKGIFGSFITPIITYCKDKYMINVSVHSVLLSEFFGKWLGLRTRDKFIPKEIILSNDNVKKGVLSGLVRSDGYYAKNTVSFCTINRLLAYSYRAVCASLGIATLLHRQLSNPSKPFVVNAYGLDAIKLHNVVKKHQTVSKTDIERIRDTSRVKRLDKGHFIAKVTRVKQDIEYSGQVYNLEVEIDNSYVTQWCVHNCSIRDFWMDSFLEESIYRRLYKLVLMPTLDGDPLHPEWISMYQNVDAITTYTEWSKQLLEEQSGGTIKVSAVTSPTVDTETFRPVADKQAHRRKFGLPDDAFVVGFVARNQKRKLYPDLAKSFAEFLAKLNNEGTENTYLYFHCAFPDLGFDIPQIIKSTGLGHKVLMTYFCQRCQQWFPAPYQDATTICRHCGAKTAVLSNSQFGVDRNALADIYNLIDLYVQYTTMEGFGIPHVEAAFCGCVTCGTDYAGTIDINMKTGSQALSVKRFYLEAETGRHVALPDNDFLVSYIRKIYSMPESMRASLGKRTAELARQNFGTWQDISQRWMDVIDSIETPENNPWTSPLNLVNTNVQCPSHEQMNDEQFIGWAVGTVLGRPEWVNSWRGLKLLRDLGWSRTVVNNLGVFANELSSLGQKPSWEAIDRNKLLQYILGQRNIFNQHELMRKQYLEQGKIV